ncbi:LysR family transcriptional regulator [Hydrogeniiclostridium mannosilyticum]|uniref:LysR family transcriptional regulator n=1 Tax=Hydrogeniiclostridium mannosilyticum TaxID=2764322 RepID=A0A328UAF2_9FIRM|nr:LysR family transcriptional regulator [Hydrogeniiclostridium mannosilyticum]RAQ28262.1 LysR family transcriptional regulator [Hydrogeniiclostridium mannosilyticum]
MELRVLNYFLAVAREENFTKAANMLHVTQPTLSRQIADLEQELGVKLFVRSNHNIVLTEDGMILKRRAQEILSLADKTKRDFIKKEEALSGTISIGSGEFRSTEYLAKIIAEFRKKYPNVKYEIYSGNATNIRDYIERGFLDMGLMSEPVDMRKYNFVNMPVKEQWGVFAPSDSSLAEKESIRPEDLAGMSVVTATGDFNQSRIGKWLGDYKDRVDIAAAANLPYNEAVLAKENIGVMLSISLNCTYENLRFIPLQPVLEISTVLGWKKDQIFSATVSAFMDFAAQYLKGISCNKI